MKTDYVVDGPDELPQVDSSTSRRVGLRTDFSTHPGEPGVVPRRGDGTPQPGISFALLGRRQVPGSGARLSGLTIQRRCSPRSQERNGIARPEGDQLIESKLHYELCSPKKDNWPCRSRRGWFLASDIFDSPGLEEVRDGMAARMRWIATTIISSIRVNPFLPSCPQHAQIFCLLFGSGKSVLLPPYRKGRPKLQSAEENLTPCHVFASGTGIDRGNVNNFALPCDSACLLQCVQKVDFFHAVHLRVRKTPLPGKIPDYFRPVLPLG